MWRFRGCPWNEHIKLCLPFGKLTWQWNMDVLKMYSLLKMGIFHCHVSLQEGTSSDIGRMNKGFFCFKAILRPNTICMKVVTRKNVVPGQE